MHALRVSVLFASAVLMPSVFAMFCLLRNTMLVFLFDEWVGKHRQRWWSGGSGGNGVRKLPKLPNVNSDVCTFVPYFFTYFGRIYINIKRK